MSKLKTRNMRYIRIAIIVTLTFLFQKSESQPLEFGLSFVPGLSYRTIEQKKSNEYPVFSYACNITANLRFKRFGFGGGVGYSRLGYSEKKDYFDSDGEILYTHRDQYLFKYFNIPIRFNYQVIDSRYPIFIGLGFENYILQNERLVFKDQEFDVKDSFSRKYNPAISASLGIEVPINKQFKSKISILYQFFPYTVYEIQNNFNRKLYSIGLNIELLFLKS